MVDISCKTPGDGVVCVVGYVDFEGVNKIHVVYYNNKTFILKNTGYLLMLTALLNKKVSNNIIINMLKSRNASLVRHSISL